MTALELRDIRHDFSGLQVLASIDLEIPDDEAGATVSNARKCVGEGLP